MSIGGLSQARLDRMHDVLAGHVEQGAAPGIVTAVSRRGEVHIDAIGMQAVAGGVPMRHDTIFRIDQITAEQKAASPFFPGFWDRHGWGFGVSMITRRDGVAAVPGRYGWDGGFGTSWNSDPHEDMVGVLMMQRLFDPVVADIHGDFWTLAYQAIDD